MANHSIQSKGAQLDALKSSHRNIIPGLQQPCVALAIIIGLCLDICRLQLGAPSALCAMMLASFDLQSQLNASQLISKLSLYISRFLLVRLRTENGINGMN